MGYAEFPVHTTTRADGLHGEDLAPEMVGADSQLIPQVGFSLPVWLLQESGGTHRPWNGAWCDSRMDVPASSAEVMKGRR